MDKLIWKTIVNALGLYLISYLLPSITVSNLMVILAAGFFLSLLSVTIRPILLVLSLPLSLLSFGFFIPVINTWMLQLTDLMVRGLYIPGFWTALAASLTIMCIDYMARIAWRHGYFHIVSNPDE